MIFECEGGPWWRKKEKDMRYYPWEPTEEVSASVRDDAGGEDVRTLRLCFIYIRGKEARSSPPFLPKV